MKFPIRCTKIFNFDKPVVYIVDGSGKTIGYIQMDDAETMIEFTNRVFPICEKTEDMEDKKE